MSVDTSAPANDGFYHPASEDELVQLVKLAYAEGRQLRVRGAVHSSSHVVYADPLASLVNRVSYQTPPPGDNIQVMLDRYRGWRVKDEARKLVEADAGIHLGEDPSDPTATATLESSLLWQLWKEKGWTLSDLGGVTHQTVSGFTSTGSSGGSLQHSVNENLSSFRVIDGTGEVYEVSRDDRDVFYAMSPNMGLLGVISTITFQCEDAYNITGQEAITTVADCAIDLLGPGGDGRPSLEQFLRDAEYARVERGGRARRRPGPSLAGPADPSELGFRPSPYEEFTAHPDTAEAFISILYTIIGNLDDPGARRSSSSRPSPGSSSCLSSSPSWRSTAASES